MKRLEDLKIIVDKFGKFHQRSKSNPTTTDCEKTQTPSFKPSQALPGQEIFQQKKLELIMMKKRNSTNIALANLSEDKKNS